MRPVLFYDGECKFCRASAAVIAALDRRQRLALLPFSDPSFRSLDRDSIHVVEVDGTVHSAGHAVIAVARRLPILHWLPWLTDRCALLERLVDRAYWAVAHQRGRLARFVPDISAVRRPVHQ